MAAPTQSDRIEALLQLHTSLLGGLVGLVNALLQGQIAMAQAAQISATDLATVGGTLDTANTTLDAQAARLTEMAVEMAVDPADPVPTPTPPVA